MITASLSHNYLTPNTLVKPMKYCTNLLTILLFACYVLTIRPVSAAETTEIDPQAAQPVEKLHAALLSTMQNAEQLGYQGRYDSLTPVIESVFDTPLISQVILSRYWNELDTDQQQNFVSLFRQLSTSTYASRFNSYSGESFKTTGIEALKKGRLLVKTELVKTDGKPVNLDYLVHQNQGNWYIISVIANGVNDLSLKRAEYASIINDKGFEHLINEIQIKIRDAGNTAAALNN